jgi:protein SCO1/2
MSGNPEEDKVDEGINRRQLLNFLATGAGIAPATGFATADQPDQEQCQVSGMGPTADRFPQHVIVIDHFGRKHRFYNDLVKGKVVMMQFMSTTTEADLKTASNLAVVQAQLGPRMGKDVFIYSITVDPESDTPNVLAEYAARHNAGPGWLFLTGAPDHMSSIRDALHFRPGVHGQHHEDQDCSMALIRYGNETAGLWGAVPTRTEPTWIVERLSWVMPSQSVRRNQAIRRGPPTRA